MGGITCKKEEKLKKVEVFLLLSISMTMVSLASELDQHLLVISIKIVWNLLQSLVNPDSKAFRPIKLDPNFDIVWSTGISIYSRHDPDYPIYETIDGGC